MRYSRLFGMVTAIGLSACIMTSALAGEPEQTLVEIGSEEELAGNEETVVESEKATIVSIETEEAAENIGNSDETEEPDVWNEKIASEPQKSGDYSYILLDDGSAKIVEYNGSDTDLVIPDDVDGHSVSSIAEDALLFGNNIRSVSIPDSLVSVDGNPFKYCMSLSQFSVSSTQPAFAVIENVLFEMADKKLVAYPAGSTADTYVVPDGIEKIGETAFSVCGSLTSVTLPESIIEIGDYAFNGCYTLSQITIPGSTAVIGANPFAACASLKSIQVSPENEYYANHEGVLFNKQDLMLVAYPCAHGVSEEDVIDISLGDQLADTEYEVPSGIVHIGDGAFYGCTDLVTVTLPDTIVSIGEAAFFQCENLKTLDIPEKVSEIGASAFSGCSSLSSINLPENMTVIKDNLFSYCTSLKKIELNPKITSIGKCAFFYCEKMEGIDLPESLTELGEEAFGYCSKIKTAAIPNHLEIIEDSTFTGCTSLSDLSLPDKLQSIGDRAFYGCTSLGEVAIPENLKHIGEEAFAECSPSASFLIVRGSSARDYFVNSGLQYSYTDAMDWLTNANKGQEEVPEEQAGVETEEQTEQDETETESETEFDELAWLNS